jgi:hypothetical protein
LSVLNVPIKYEERTVTTTSGSPPEVHGAFLPSTQLFEFVLTSLLEETLNELVGGHSRVEKHSYCERRWTLEKSRNKT